MSAESDNKPKQRPLDDIREAITQLDADLLSLFAKRRDLSLSVALSKESTLKPIRDQEREKELLERLVEEGASAGLDAHYVTKLFHTIIEDSLSIQRNYLQSQSNPEQEPEKIKTIAVLGGLGAYSYLAARKHFARSQNNYLGCSTFDKVLKSVEQGKADFGVIPIENTTSGGITEVYDLLLDSQLTIIGEEKYPIKHCLVANKGTELTEIKTIYGHPEASRQCNKNLPKSVSASVSLVSSTAEALQLAEADESGEVAAIASETSAEQFGLQVLLRDVANLKENTTRFLVVAKESKKVSPQVTSKTSIAISTGQKPGSLAEVLLVFRDADIPLSKLESRPIPGKPWEQMFYIDLEGNIGSENVSKALEDVSRLCRFMKVLGSYATEDTNVTQVSSEALSRTKVQSVGQVEQALGSEAQATDDLALPYHLASRAHKPNDTVIEVKGAQIGGPEFTIIAGPQSVESNNQIEEAAKMVAECGASILRGGCFHPQTLPAENQTAGFDALEILAKAGHRYQLPVITEVMSPEEVKRVAEGADILQIGARNMHNFALLKMVGQTNRPVMLKRGLMASIDELLSAAEYILSHGNMQVFLCERGIRTFETATRDTLDLSAVPLLKRLTHLPVIVDPSRAVGHRDLIAPLAMAAKAVGADGVMVNFDPQPKQQSATDANSLSSDQFAHLVHALHSSN